MPYWSDTYGKNRSRDFIDGVIAGVETFAVWRNGKRYVGVLRTPLVDALASIEGQLGGDKNAESS